MFRIGEFSHIGCVTIDTLRHYDDLGLLKPERVDRFTGYRYYSAKQLQVLNRIRAFKEVGLSLAEIACILQDELTVEELRSMLKAQLVATESVIETAQLQREKILARLHQLTLEDNMSEYEVSLKSVEAHTVASIRETVPTVEQMPQRCGRMFDKIAGWMAANGLPFGSPLTIYHDESHTREQIDTECAFIIPGLGVDQLPLPVSPIVVRQIATLPQVATTIVTNDFYQKVEGLTPAYNAIGQWIEDNGYRIVGAPRELFHGSPEKGDLTAEIQFPVERL